MEAGDLLLVDAAANYGYQASDITRTYPISGSFTAVQRDIYEIVLHALEAVDDVQEVYTTALLENA